MVHAVLAHSSLRDNFMEVKQPRREAIGTIFALESGADQWVWETGFEKQLTGTSFQKWAERVLRSGQAGTYEV